MTVYRPSARIRLTIRTEEFEDTSDLESRLEDPEGATAPVSTSAEQDDSPAERLRRNQERRTQLELQRESLAQEDYEQQRQQIDAERASIMRANSQLEESEARPPESVSGQRDDLTVVGDILPMSAQIQRNGLATADTANMTINYADAPIDPRIVRSAHVELTIGVVRAEDYEAGIERNNRRDDGTLTSVVGPDSDGILTGATKFMGFIDDWSVDYSNDGDIISFDCRDMSAPLRDIPLPSGMSIDLSLPIDEGIRQLLDLASATTRGVEVVYNGSDSAPVPANAMPQRRRPNRGRSARRARRGNSQMSLWDHIMDTVVALGLLPVVRGYTILIISPRTLYTSIGSTRMVYGRNISKLSFSRSLQGQKVPTIEVRCYDPERGRTLWARYPVRSGDRSSGVFGIDDPTQRQRRRRRGSRRANDVTPSGSNPDERIKTITVSGINDTRILEQIAENSYEQIGRQEISVEFETDDVWSYGLPPEEADLLMLQAGDSVEILVASSASENEENIGSNSTLAQIQAMDRRRRTDYFVSLGWNSTVASRFAALQDATGFQTIFRVQDVRLSYDNDQGMKISVSCVNYITVREEEWS